METTEAFDERFARADTVIVVARPRLACSLRPSLDLHGTMASQSRPRNVFKDSIGVYRWIWNYERDSRPRLDSALQRHDHLDVVKLKTRKAIARCLEDADLH